MDDLTGAGNPMEDLEDDEMFHAAIGLAHVILMGSLLWCCCRSFCCRRARVEAQTGDATTLGVDVDHLQTQKKLSTSYLLWFAAGPIGNAHHFYLDRIVHGLVAVWTANFLCIGWVVDAVMMPYYVRSFNAGRTAQMAPTDTSSRRLLCRLPMMWLCLVAPVIGTALYGPYVLHSLGAVDIDRIAAQTQENPYDVLGITRGAGLSEAKSAYRTQSLRWHPDRNAGCGKKCEHKMGEIAKAYDLIKKRKAPSDSGEKTWESWVQDLGSDWWAVLEVISQADEEANPRKSDL
mmetsp:Transcript_19347/g.41142  ORF Transcript_19347/g.41142 Transcript_19347/m.41142 type:complete len:290 (-) Transcript_19347:38-907(-)